MHTNTDRLFELGVHNTLDEIAEAQRTAQLERLSQTRTGCYNLRRLGLRRQEMQDNKVPTSLPQDLLHSLHVPPVPRHMNPEHNQERRLARAKTLTATHATDKGAFYVDVAQYPDRPNAYVAVVIAAVSGDVYTASSMKARSAHHAEEMAIALAITNPRCTTVLSDSKTAIMHYATNCVSPSVVRVCGALPPRTTPVTLRWFPAHVGPLDSRDGHGNRNEEADRAAHALTSRGAPESPSPRFATQVPEETEPLTAYRDILEWYRINRRTFPPPHPNLTRQEAVIYRQLQTCSLMTPVVAKHICPEVYVSDMCTLCNRERATMAHILWDCENHPQEARNTTIPPRFMDAMKNGNYEDQLQAVQLAMAGLERQRPASAASTEVV